MSMTGPIGYFVHHQGRGHAERLIPLIAELPDRGRAARILVSLGPGSFTGRNIFAAIEERAWASPVWYEP